LTHHIGTPPHFEIPQVLHAERFGTDLGAELDRSRAGTRPISTRNWTDLGVKSVKSVKSRRALRRR